MLGWPCAVDSLSLKSNYWADSSSSNSPSFSCFSIHQLILHLLLLLLFSWSFTTVKRPCSEYFSTSNVPEDLRVFSSLFCCLNPGKRSGGCLWFSVDVTKYLWKYSIKTSWPLTESSKAVKVFALRETHITLSMILSLSSLWRGRSPTVSQIVHVNYCPWILIPETANGVFAKINAA